LATVAVRVLRANPVGLVSYDLLAGSTRYANALTDASKVRHSLYTPGGIRSDFGRVGHRLGIRANSQFVFNTQGEEVQKELKKFVGIAGSSDAADSPDIYYAIGSMSYKGRHVESPTPVCGIYHPYSVRKLVIRPLFTEGISLKNQTNALETPCETLSKR
jgi:hypothetical protein